jgi:hypothetical protein
MDSICRRLKASYRWSTNERWQLFSGWVCGDRWLRSSEKALLVIPMMGTRRELPPVVLLFLASMLRLISYRRDYPSLNLSSNAHSPCFCMTERVLTTTLDEGRMRTCLFPRRSALTMLFYHIISTSFFQFSSIFAVSFTHHAVVKNGAPDHFDGFF